MTSGALGRSYADGEVIIRQGDTGDCMYVIQEGKVEVIKEEGGKEIRLMVLDTGDFFGEMAIFEKEVRSATVRALGATRILTVDKRSLLRNFHQDPSLAFKMVQTMSNRIRQLVDEVARLNR